MQGQLLVFHEVFSCDHFTIFHLLYQYFILYLNLSIDPLYHPLREFNVNISLILLVF